MATTFPYATLTNIQSSSWEMMLDSTAGGGAGSGLGQVCQSYADVHQCLKIIFSTIPGEDPFRPTFGCDLTQFLDRPLTAAIPAIVGAISAAIADWEPRITLESVDVVASTTNIGTLDVTINWKPDMGSSSSTTTTIGTESTTISVGGAS